MSEFLPVIIVSRALTYEVLAHACLSSSSQKFERGFAKACADITEVTVINMNNVATHPTDEKVIDGMPFYVTRYRDLFGTIRKAARGRRVTVITTGYDPVLMLVLVLCRPLLRLRTFTFIYDTHKLAMQNRPLLRKMAIGIYFNVGFFIARFLSGWIVLNDRFVSASRLPTPPYLKTRIGVDEFASTTTPVEPAPNNSRPVFLFSGTLSNDNGIQILLQAVEQMRNQDFELHVYGYGPLAHLVEGAAERDKRIVFHGRVDNAEILARQRSADALIHLRDPSSMASNYSYPSKLIEYISSGTRVLSNMYPAIADVEEFVFPIGDYGSASLALAMREVLEGKITLADRPAARARFFAERNWNAIAAGIQDFVTAEPRTLRRGSSREEERRCA